MPLARLDAGLRTGHLAAPFPEEEYRQLVSRIATLHLAPAETAAAPRVVPANLPAADQALIPCTRLVLVIANRGASRSPVS